MKMQQVERFKRLSLPLVIAAVMGTAQFAEAKPLSQFELAKHRSVSLSENAHRYTSKRPEIDRQFNNSLNSNFGRTDYSKLTRLAKGVSKSAAASAARSKYGGKVLKVSASGSGYKVKLLLDNGRVKVVTVDANGKVR